MLREFRAGLSVLDGTDDAERLDLIGELEALKAAACAAQALSPAAPGTGRPGCSR